MAASGDREAQAFLDDRAGVDDSDRGQLALFKESEAHMGRVKGERSLKPAHAIDRKLIEKAVRGYCADELTPAAKRRVMEARAEQIERTRKTGAF